jgi:TetR/AcrR family transcriptional repressor of nem operon
MAKGGSPHIGERAMGHSKAEKAATHERIVEIAARHFRERGLDGVIVAEVTKEAGLTPGGLYRHFASRDELITAAIAKVYASLDEWERGVTSLAQVVRYYLSPEHRDVPGSGCSLGAVLGDISRSSDAARDLYTEQVQRAVAFSERLLDAPEAMRDEEGSSGCANGGAPDASGGRRALALMQLCACIGALGMAHAVSDGAFSDDVLMLVRDQLLAILPPG